MLESAEWYCWRLILTSQFVKLIFGTCQFVRDDDGA